MVSVTLALAMSVPVMVALVMPALAMLVLVMLARVMLVLVTLARVTLVPVRVICGRVLVVVLSLVAVLLVGVAVRCHSVVVPGDLVGRTLVVGDLWGHHLLRVVRGAAGGMLAVLVRENFMGLHLAEDLRAVDRGLVGVPGLVRVIVMVAERYVRFRLGIPSTVLVGA